MVALGMGIVWAGWALGLYGFCLIRGYDVTLGQLVNPVNIYSGGWPPPFINDPSVILPGQAGTGSAAASFTNETGSVAQTGQSSSISSTGGVRQTGTAPES
jgi:hypothetical protein